MAALACGILSNTGCRLLRGHAKHVPHPAPDTDLFHPCPNAGNELEKLILTEYRIEPPDVIDITVVNVVPKAPYYLKVGDSLAIDVVGTLPEEPIQGLYPVGIGGSVNLGFQYGSVPNVGGSSLEEAEAKILKHLQEYLRAPEVTVSLGQLGSLPQIAGPRAVALDGRVNLGTYGTLSIVGKTVPEATAALEAHLSQYLDAPEVSVTVTQPNSKFYYIITQGAGQGDQVLRVPIQGNETVLDAIAGIGQIPTIASQKIWIARPGRHREGRDQVLKIDFRAITQLGDPATNYQILPGDRLYLGENKWLRVANDVRTVLAPFQAIAQFANLGVQQATRFSGNVLRGGGNPALNVNGANVGIGVGL